MAKIKGITPACAGKRQTRQGYRANKKDHPRVRGEKIVFAYIHALLLGSPPRARGKVRSLIAVIHHLRITPACAGKSKHKYGAQARTEDHPRVRGEKYSQESFRVNHGGSPPRARGKVSSFIAAADGRRITPACAGKSALMEIKSSLTQDHPRVRGEKSPTHAPRRRDLGSPPRARGKVHTEKVPRLPVGITPACAGKSCLYDASFCIRKDHPRVRGEK